MKKRNQLGEIATVITLGTIIVVGLASLLSNVLLKKSQTTSTKAAVSCDKPEWSCADECAPLDARYAYLGMNGQNNTVASTAWRTDKAQNCGLTESQCNLTDKCQPIGVPTVPPPPAGTSCDPMWYCGGECAKQSTRDLFGDALKWRKQKAQDCTFSSESECSTRTDCPEGSYKAPGSGPNPPPGASSGTCSCVNGKASDVTACGDTNPCGPEIGTCNKYGDWKNECTGSAQNCPADAGVTYTSWCDGTKWRFQYPNCVAWCKPDYINKPPATAVGACTGKSAGTSIDPANAGTVPAGIIAGSTVAGLTANLYYTCDGNQGVYVNISPFCDQFGQVQWGPGQKTTFVCAPPDIGISKAPGSFTLNLNVYVTKTANGFDFTNEAKIHSNNCDGDLRFSRGGAFINITRWNRGDQGDTFTWGKEFLGNVSITNGDSKNVTFEAALLNCPRSTVPITDTVSCNFGVSPYGIPWVRGAGCVLANFSDVQKITPLPTPKTQVRPTWSAPPALTNVTPIIFSRTGTPGGVGTTPGPGTPPPALNITPALNVCPDDGVNSTCVVKVPLFSGCPVGFDATNALACVGPVAGWAKTCCVKRDAMATVAPTKTPMITQRIEVDEWTSTRQWLTNANVCDYVGNWVAGIGNLRNCRPPKYVTDPSGRKYIEATFSPSQKTALCTIGGQGYCTFLN